MSLGQGKKGKNERAGAVPEDPAQAKETRDTLDNAAESNHSYVSNMSSNDSNPILSDIDADAERSDAETANKKKVKRKHKAVDHSQQSISNFLRKRKELEDSSPDKAQRNKSPRRDEDSITSAPLSDTSSTKTANEAGKAASPSPSPPPKGAAASNMFVPFTQTTPARSFGAMSRARLMFSDQSVAARP